MTIDLLPEPKKIATHPGKLRLPSRLLGTSYELERESVSIDS